MQINYNIYRSWFIIIYLKYLSPPIVIPIVPAIVLLCLRAPAVEIYQFPSCFWLRFLFRRLGRLALFRAENTAVTFSDDLQEQNLPPSWRLLRPTRVIPVIPAVIVLTLTAGLTATTEAWESSGVLRWGDVLVTVVVTSATNISVSLDLPAEPDLLSPSRLVHQARVLAGQIVRPGCSPERGEVQSALLVNHVSHLPVVQTERPGQDGAEVYGVFLTTINVTYLPGNTWCSRGDVGQNIAVFHLKQNGISCNIERDGWEANYNN